MRETLSSLFIIPVPARWNSMFYAMENMRIMIDKSGDNLSKITDTIAIKKPFNQADVLFIEEYCIVMSPISTALTILEGENYMFLSYLLHTLTVLNSELKTLSENIIYCKSLGDSRLEGIEKRFEYIFRDKKFILASITIPQFKTAWMTNEEKLQEAIAILKEEINGLTLIYSDHQSISDSEKSSEDGYFSSINYHPEVNRASINEYLTSREKTIDSLKSHPKMEKVFRKNNTTLPSSASVERLVSQAAGIFEKIGIPCTTTPFRKSYC